MTPFGKGEHFPELRHHESAGGRRGDLDLGESMNYSYRFLISMKSMEGEHVDVLCIYPHQSI